MFTNIFNKSIKFLVPSLFGIILCLKLTDRPRVWLTDLLIKSHDDIAVAKQSSEEQHLERKKLVDELENFERNFFRNRDKPTKNCQKCDACRTIAYTLDKEFENAEAQMGITPAYYYDQGDENNLVDELKAEDVRNILNKVCRRKTFSSVQPIYLNGKWRLVASGLET